jgi:hypothetical protein
MKEFLEKLFSSDFMPHGYCYLWKPGLVWLHVFSDTLIALAYFAIPVTLVYFIRKRRDLPFHWMFVSFGAKLSSAELRIHSLLTAFMKSSTFRFMVALLTFR